MTITNNGIAIGIVGAFALALWWHATRREAFEPSGSMLAMHVIQKFRKFVELPPGSVVTVDVVQMRTLGTEQKGIASVVSLGDTWSARVQARFKVLTRGSGAFVTDHVMVDGSGMSEQAAVADARSGIEAARREIEVLLR